MNTEKKKVLEKGWNIEKKSNDQNNEKKSIALARQGTSFAG